MHPHHPSPSNLRVHQTDCGASPSPNDYTISDLTRRRVVTSNPCHPTSLLPSNPSGPIYPSSGGPTASRMIPNNSNLSRPIHSPDSTTPLAEVTYPSGPMKGQMRRKLTLLSPDGTGAYPILCSRHIALEPSPLYPD